MTMFSLEGHVALITGSTRGLGRAMVDGLARAGARVAMNYHNDTETAEAAFAAFRDAGHEGMLIRGDVTDANDVKWMVEEISKTLGPVDILVPNATCAQPLKPIEEYDWDFYQTMIDFFIKSPYLLTRACLGPMKEKRWGRIINICSEVFARGTPNFTAYVAAKGGQVGFSRSLASELSPHGITVNMVAPGWIPVERHANDKPEDKEAYLAQIPMKRWGIPDDVVGAVVFLASDEASFITGQSLDINGGITVG